MTEWYDGLAGIEQFLLGIAVFSTLIFMIQLCLSLIGIAGDDLDFDSDVGDGGFEFGEIFTLRNGWWPDHDCLLHGGSPRLRGPVLGHMAARR